jgi:hypothetical protein
MRKCILLLVFLLFYHAVSAFLPSFYGARSLSLGYGASAFVYDVNAIFINPALLAKINQSMSGFQTQYNYFDPKQFLTDLDQVLDYDLKNYEIYSSQEKSLILAKLATVFNARRGIYGGSYKMPGLIVGKYGISMSWVKSAIINPVASQLLTEDANALTNADIDSLKMNMIGFDYRQLSLSYGLMISKTISCGITLSYLNGKINQQQTSINNSIFQANKNAKSYFQTMWDQSDDSFSKIVSDFSLNLELGAHVNVSYIVKNIGSPAIETNFDTISIPRRSQLAISFRPDVAWGFFMDVDIAKTALLYNDSEFQPFSVGIEKGLFQNKFLLRLGILNDLTEKKFFSRQAGAMFCLGCGVHVDNLIADVAVGLDHNGDVNSLALSGFIILK